MRDRLIELLMNSEVFNEADGKADSKCLADHLLANGVTVQEWISVKDRLPEKNGLVLGYDIGFGVLLIYYEAGCVRSGWQSVTHWMPLPQPPKGE